MNVVQSEQYLTGTMLVKTVQDGLALVAMNQEVDGRTIVMGTCGLQDVLRLMCAPKAHQCRVS
jgi:hypothetical protein